MTQHQHPPPPNPETDIRSEFNRPGAHSTKTARQAGAPNHLQGSGEAPMVGNNASSRPGANGPQEAQRQRVTDADKLTQDAVEASRIRKLSTHPDVIALRVEKVRAQVDRLMWTG